MSKDWVDFNEVKKAVTMLMVLDHYNIKGLNKVGEDLRGPCPIHKGGPKTKHLSVNLAKNAFKCFSSNCPARGNVLDFVAAMERCSVRDAALKLQEWFKIGESVAELEEVGSVRSLTTDQFEALKQLSAELDNHAARIAYHSSQAEGKIAAVKEILGALN